MSGARSVQLQGTSGGGGGGTVTQLDTGTGLTGGPITTAGTVSIASTTVTAGTYGDSTHVGQFTVNARGQLTFAANVAISSTAGGTVTQIDTGTGLTGGPITNAGTVSITSGGITSGLIASAAVVTASIATGAVVTASILAGAVVTASIFAGAVTTSAVLNSAITYAKIQNVTNQRFLANYSGGAAAPAEIQLIAGSGITFSATTTSLTITSTITGSGSATLVAPQGRLTLQSGFPVMNADQSAKSTVYYDSFIGGYCPVYNGSTWDLLAITNDEISMGLDTGNVVSGSLYDVWAVNNSGSLAIGIGPAWSSSTSRGAGAGTTEYQRLNGIPTNKNSLTHVYGGASGTTDYGSVSANRATLLGTLYATANGQTSMEFFLTPASGGTDSKLALSNAFNRVMTRARNRDSKASWTYASNTWEPLDGGSSNTKNRISFVDCLQQTQIYGHLQVMNVGGAGNFTNLGMNIDATTGTPNITMQVGGVQGTGYNGCEDEWQPVLGFHYIQAMEMAGAGTGTFDANDSSPTRPYEGLTITLMM